MNYFPLQPVITDVMSRRRQKQPAVSMIVPVYNEEQSVMPLLRELVVVGESLRMPFEIIFIDDGSTDHTVLTLTKMISEFEGILKVVELRRNYGQTAALAAGFAVAQGEVCVTLDGDLQNDPQDIPLLLYQMIETGADMVCGWRQNRQDAVWSRKIPSYLANRLIGSLTGVRFRDYGCSLKAYRRELAQEIPLYGELHRFIPVLADMEGARIEEVPVSHRARQYGTSKYTLSRTFKVLLDLGMLLFLKRFFTRPLHLFGRMGLMAMASGFGILGYLTLQKLVFHFHIGDRPLLLLGSLLLLTGIQLLSTGLIAELQIRTYFESQKKSPYKIRHVHQ
jgi:glycosyltransferase involved in cell wall biosynthesis